MGGNAGREPGQAGLPLAADEPPPFACLQAQPRFPVLLACDHASPWIPRALGNLGIPDSRRLDHIAWDIGAGDLTRALAAILGVPAVLSGYSRLVVDCNRHLDDPSAFAAESDGTAVPGNAALDAAGREARAAALYWPYHGAVAAALRSLAGGVRRPALVAIHSFTPAIGGSARPWHAGILWDRDPRLALPLLAALHRDPALHVGDNEPYSGRHPAGFTIDHHAEAAGLPHVSIEVRQDLIAGAAGVAAWAARLAGALGPLLADPVLYRAEGAP